MSNGAKVAMAVGAGYMLGRTKKMRLALMLAAAGITGKFPTGPTQLVAQGLKSLGASADVSQLTEQLRGELLSAGRAAALSAATSQIDSLNERLQGVTSAVDAVDVDDTLDDVGGLVGGVGKRRRTRSEDEDYVDEDDAYDEPVDEDEEEPVDVDEVDEDMDEDDEDIDEDVDEDEVLEDEDEEPDEEPEEEPEPPVTRRRAAKRPSTPRKSVRATKRSAARSTSRRGR